MKEYLTIFGEKITGKIHAERKNTIIVEDERGERHVVHKIDAGMSEEKKSELRFELGFVQNYGCRTAALVFKTPSRDGRYQVI